MKVTEMGQVTIPFSICQLLGISGCSGVEFAITDGQVILRKVPAIQFDESETCGGRFRKLRGLKKGTVTTDDWMATSRGAANTDGDGDNERAPSKPLS